MEDNLKKQLKRELRKRKTIFGDRTTLQIRKTTLKKMLEFKEKEFHPRATYDEMLNKMLDKELKKLRKLPT